MQTANASILVVDDSDTMRRIIRDMLQRIGVRHIEEAADGREALARVQRNSFTAIVSDWHMAPMTGIELLREVRRISTPSSNRFIMATTEHSWGSKTTAKIDGVDAFLVKPFTIEDLKATLDLVLRRRGDV